MADKAKLIIEHAEVLGPMFRNFRGEKRMYNAEGQKNFNVVLEPDVAQRLIDDGVNVRYLKSRDDEDEKTPFVKVTVRFHGEIARGVYQYEGNDPRVYQYTMGGKKRVRLNPVTIGLLDTADVENWDLVCNLYERNWDEGKTTVTLYLEELHAVLRETAFEEKYANATEEAYGMELAYGDE